MEENQKIEKKTNWSKYNKRNIGFKCPIELLEVFNTTNGKSKTDIILDALRSYRSKEFRDKLLNMYIKFNAFFKQVTEFFANLTNQMDIEKFMELMDKNITQDDFYSIDEINEVLGLK